jgi:hypothetical protein
MKKFLFIVLLITYGFSSSGITLQFHFCCGKLKAIGLSTKTDHGCEHNRKTSLPCCESKYFVADAIKDYDKNPDNLPGLKFHPAQDQQFFLPLKANADYFQNTFVNTGPITFATPLFIFYCVYRI